MRATASSSPFISVPLIVFLSCLAGYGLTRYHFRFSRTIYLYFLAGLLIPIQLTILPSLLQMKSLHLVNTHAGLITLYTALGLPFSVFLMAGFMNHAGELAEAARLDGAGEFRAFWDVVVPLTKPALATVAILNGVCDLERVLPGAHSLARNVPPSRSASTTCAAITRPSGATSSPGSWWRRCRSSSPTCC